MWSESRSLGVVTQGRRRVVRVGPIARNQRGRGHTMTHVPRWQRVWKNEGHLQYRRCGTGSYQEAVKNSGGCWHFMGWAGRRCKGVTCDWEPGWWVLRLAFVP